MNESPPRWIAALCAEERLPPGYPGDVLNYVAPLADRIAGLRQRRGRPVVVGINGAQGSGKSTLALFLCRWLKTELNLSCASVSIDDLYLSHAARRALADSQHPLLLTRGVPGTHDVSAGLELIQSLTTQGPPRIVSVPSFNKATDDVDEPRSVEGPVDVVVFEGWCVGAIPQNDDELAQPVNALESEEDTDTGWRRYVNGRLASDYQRLFGLIDVLVMLRIPSFDKVIEWRGLQESKLRASSSGGLDAPGLELFVMHYERLTRHMLRTMPGYADTVIDVAADHRFVAMNHQAWG